MDLKKRFSILLSLFFVLCFSIFSLLLYVKLKRTLISNAEQNLLAHVQHELRHIDHLKDNAPLGTFTAKNIYERVLEEQTLLFDSFPKDANAPIQTDDRIQKTVKREIEGKHYTLIEYFDLSSINSYLRILRNELIIASLLSSLFVFPISLIFMRIILTPFRELAKKTSDLDVEKLSFRFTEPSQSDEYGNLIRNFNALLDRLENSFGHLKRYGSDVSHELRTPLTVIRGEAEVTLRKKRPLAEYEEILRRVIYQVETLQGITSGLLFISEIDRMEQEKQKVPIPVNETLQELVDTLRLSYKAERTKISIHAGGSESFFYYGYKELFLSIANNLIENAVKNARDSVRIKTQASENHLILTVEDDGPGIPEEKYKKVFEPFFKIHPGGKKSGYGLGLSITKACVEACRGKIELGKSALLGGLSVSVELPA